MHKQTEQIVFLLLGILLVIGGGQILFDPTKNSFFYSFTFDYSGYNIPLGLFLIAVGLVCLYTSIVNLRKGGKKPNQTPKRTG
jgi:uncharacterized membrane protein HdeD (DUF308 family)